MLHFWKWAGDVGELNLEAGRLGAVGRHCRVKDWELILLTLLHFDNFPDLLELGNCP